MQQQVQTHLPAERVLSEASSFFTKRRAKVSDRTSQGFSFALPGSDEGGRLRISPAVAGASGTTVTVEAEGLGVLAIAEGYVRELRKQSRSQGRPGGGAGNVALSDLRQRLGMPEPRPRVRQPTEASAPAESSEVGGEGKPHGGGGADVGVRRTLAEGARPDGPTPNEAASVTPETGPQGAPAPRIEQGAADHRTPAEAAGGVPSPDEVSATGEPETPNPGTAAGGAAGAEAPEKLGAEAGEAPAQTQRQGG